MNMTIRRQHHNLTLSPAAVGRSPVPAAGYGRPVSAPDLPIRTERLLLRGFVIDDLDDFHAYHGLPEVARHLYRAPRSIDRSRQMLARASELTFDGENDVLVLAVQAVGSTTVIGEVVLKWANERAQQSEVGYIFHPEAADRGYATEAAKAMLQLGFEHYGFHRIVTRLDAETPRRRRSAADLACDRRPT